MSTRLTAPLADVAKLRPASPPRVHAMPAPTGPGRSHIMAEPRKKRAFLDASQKAILVVKVKQAFEAEPGTPRAQIIERIAKTNFVSASLVSKLLKSADEEQRESRIARGDAKDAPTLRIEIDGLEEFIEWHVARAVRRQLKKALGE